MTVTGRPGELVLVLFGRPAEVAVDGSAEAVAGWHRSALGL